MPETPPSVIQILHTAGAEAGEPATRIEAGALIRVVGVGFGATAARVRAWFDDTATRVAHLPFSDDELFVAAPLPTEASRSLAVEVDGVRSEPVPLKVVRPRRAPGEPGEHTVEFFAALHHATALLAATARGLGRGTRSERELAEVAAGLDAARRATQRSVELLLGWRECQRDAPLEQLQTIRNLDDTLYHLEAIPRVEGWIDALYGRGGVMSRGAADFLALVAEAEISATTEVEVEFSGPGAIDLSDLSSEEIEHARGLLGDVLDAGAGVVGGVVDGVSKGARLAKEVWDGLSDERKKTVTGLAEGTLGAGGWIFDMGSALWDCFPGAKGAIGFGLHEFSKLMESFENFAKLGSPSLSTDIGMSYLLEGTVGVDVSFYPGEAVSGLAKLVDSGGQLLMELDESDADDERKATLKSIKEEVLHNQGALHSLEAKVDTTTATLGDGLKRGFTATGKKIDELGATLERRIDDLRIDIAGLRTELRDGLAALRQRLDALEPKLDQLGADIVALNQTMNQRFDSVDKGAQATLDAVRDVNQGVAAIEGKLDALATELGALKSAVDEVRSRVRDVQATQLQIQDALAAIRASVTDIHAVLRDVRTALVNIRTTLGDIRTALANLQTSVNNVQGQLIVLLGRVNAVLLGIQALANRLAAVHNVANQILTLAAAIRGAVDQLRDLAARIHGLLVDLVAAAEALEVKLDGVEVKLDALPAPRPQEVSVAAQRGGGQAVTAALAAISSGDAVHLRAAIDVAPARVDELGAYSPWIDFGRPAAARKLVSVSIDLQYVDGSDERIEALLTVRDETGGVFIRALAARPPGALIDPTQWTAWDGFPRQP